MKLFFLLSSLFFVTNLNAQIFIKAKVISTGQDSCGINVTFSEINLPVLSQLYFIGSPSGVPMSSPVAISLNDTLVDLCEGTDPYVFDNVALAIIGSDTLISSLIPSNLDFQIVQYNAPTGSLSNGAMTLKFLTQLSSQPLISQDGSSLTTGFYNNDSLVINGLANGKIEIIFNVGLELAHLRGFIGDITQIQINNQLIASVQVTDASNNCNGVASLSIQNGQAPYQIDWNLNEYNGLQNVDSLCPGHYEVFIEDALGANTIVEFIIVDSIDQYVEVWENDTSTNVTTIQLLFENCNLDYTSVIDTVLWYETIAGSNGDTVFTVFSMDVVQGIDTFSLQSAVLPLVNTQFYILDVAIFCEYFKSNNFKGKRLLLSGDGNQSVGVEGLKLQNSNIVLFPNPANDVLNVQINSSESNINVQLIDLMGKVVSNNYNYINSKIIQFDISALQKGMYFIQFSNGNESTLKQFIKQ